VFRFLAQGGGDPITDVLLKSYGPVGILAAIIWWIIRQWMADMKETLAICREAEKEARAQVAHLQEAARESIAVITRNTDLVQRISDDLWRKRRATG
jgi:hypothetical protein